MAKEGSVAPKERVNIVYRPATGGAQEEVELPLRVLVMGDFTGKPDNKKLEEREITPIDKDNFNEVLRGRDIGLSVTVPNKISGKPDDEMSVKLNFKSLEEIGPEFIAKNTPELKRLLEMREALTSLRAPLSNLPDFRKKIQELIKDEATRERLLKELGAEER